MKKFFLKILFFIFFISCIGPNFVYSNNVLNLPLGDYEKVLMQLKFDSFMAVRDHALKIESYINAENLVKKNP